MRAFALTALFAGAALATEAIYLANGINSYNPCGGNGYQTSVIAYYDNIDDSQNGQQPGDTATARLCGYEHWEGGQVTGTFSSGTTFQVSLDSGAQSYSVGQCESWSEKATASQATLTRLFCSDAGYGTNSYGTGFDCFRDNGMQILSPDAGSICVSLDL